MIIECPACHTRYRTDGSLSITESTLFECSREQCGYVFSYFPESPRETGADPLPGESFVDPPDAQDAEPYLAVDDDFSPSPSPSFARTSDEPAAVLSSSRPASPTKASVSTPQMTKSFTDDFTDPEDFSLEPPSLSSLAPPASPSVTNEEVRRNEPRRRATPPHQRPATNTADGRVGVASSGVFSPPRPGLLPTREPLANEHHRYGEHACAPPAGRFLICGEPILATEHYALRGQEWLLGHER